MEELDLLNVKVVNCTNRQLLEAFNEGIVVPLNADVMMKIQRDKDFWKDLNSNREHIYMVMDSQVIRLIYRLLFRNTFIEKISGSDFFPLFVEAHKDDVDTKIFLFGAGPGVADLVKIKVNNQAGRDIVVGSHSPSFGFEKNSAECEQIVELINQSGASVLAVGLGCPKQEKFIFQYKSRLPNVKRFIAVGATFDFQAGLVKRAPSWISNIGFEWAYRLMMEPRRLAKRYLIDDIPIIWLMVKQRFGMYSNPHKERL